LKLAAAGRACRQVPRVLSAYRVHPAGMLNRTDRTSEDIARYFHSKFRALLAVHSNLDSYFGFPSVAGPRAIALPQQLLRPLEEGSEALEQRLRAANHQLASVYASASWRVTGPLRAAYRLITGRP
jgi:hypothetical protein